MRNITGARPGGSDAPLRELHEFDMIVTARQVDCDDRTIPAGSEGTIVDVSPVAGYFEVEFFAPFHCIATVHVSQIA